MDPLQPERAFGVAGRTAERAVIFFAQIFADRARFKERQIAVDQRRDAAERMDRQVFLGAQELVIKRHVHQLERHPQFVQQPQRAHRTGFRAVIKNHRHRLGSPRTGVAR
jgi:hypothetical protein